MANNIQAVLDNIQVVLDNISDAVYGSYSGKDSEGVSFRERYEKYNPPVGKRGMREDKKNLAKDLNKAIRLYEQKKE